MRIRDWGFIEWAAVCAALAVLVIGIAIAIQLPGFIRGCAKVVDEVTEDITPQECKRQCEQAGASRWYVSEGGCTCGGEMGDPDSTAATKE
jgi:hypothetical protein